MSPEEFNHIIAPMRDNLKLSVRNMTGNDDLAEDMVQEVMLKLWSMRGELDRYKDKQALAFTMLRNKIRDGWRHEKIVTEAVCRHDGHGREDLTTEHADELELIRQIVEHLPPLQGRIFRMKEIEGYSNDEIMQITGCTQESLRQNVSRARRRIISDYARLTRMRIHNGNDTATTDIQK